MTKLEFEAETLDEAIQLAKSKVPKEKIILALEVQEDGHQPDRRNFFAYDEEAAQKQIDAFSREHKRKIIDQTLLRERRVERKTVEAKGDFNGYRILSEEHSTFDGIFIGPLKRIEPAHKGFLGIGKSQDRYESYVVFGPIFEVTFAPSARVKITFGEVEEIKGYLLNRDPQIRKATAKLMTDNNYAMVTQILVDLLGDTDTDVRDTVIQVIWQREGYVNCRYTVESLLDEIRYGAERGMLGKAAASLGLPEAQKKLNEKRIVW